MVEKKKPSRNSKDKISTPIQKTLFDLFPKKRGYEVHPEPGAQDTEDKLPTERPSVAAPLDLPQETSSDWSKAPPDIKHGTANPKLYSIFEQSDVPLKKTSAQLSGRDLEGNVVEIVDNDRVAGPSKIVLKPMPVTKPQSRSSHASVSIDGSSPHDPIILDASPLKIPAIRSTRSFPQTPYSIFATTKKHDTKSSETFIPHTKAAKSVEAPFPDKDFQHVPGPQSLFLSPDLNFSFRASRNHAISFTDTSKYWLANLPVSDDESFHHDHFAIDMHFLPASTTSDRQTYLQTIPSEHIRYHPAVKQLLDTHLSHASDFIAASSQKTWADRWRPTRAEQVLGNERQALYLRDWLRALELEFVVSAPATALPTKTKGKAKAMFKEAKRDLKRPRIIRAVEKKRGKKKQRMDSEEEDDWIIGSDESSEQYITDGDSEGEFGGEIRLQNQDAVNGTDVNHPANEQDGDHAGVSPAAHSFQMKLTNTILIAGPPGCGKTAGVYACADELGWEVFEVYPGIGRRNASSLDNLVGDVGKNHLVRKTQQHTCHLQMKDAFTALLGREGREKASDEIQPATQEKPIEVEDTEDQSGHNARVPTPVILSNPPPSDDLDAKQATAVMQQSMVLLEEVDILFKEDSSFWPAVINLIKDCKRPVIMTCNDVTLVPTANLPLQNILNFESIPPPLAVSYLQSLCLAEGQLVERESLHRLYETTYELSAVDQSVSNPSRDGLPVPDLRRAIHQLQFMCSSKAKRSIHCTNADEQSNTFEDMVDWTGVAEALRTEDPQGQLVQLARLADLLSYMDSNVVRHPLEKPEALTYNQPDEEELGHTVLVPENLSGGLAFHYQDDEMAQWIIRLSREALKVPGPRIRRIANATKASYGYEISEAFRSSIGWSAWPIRSAVHLDYEPWIRRMVSIDDMHEKKAGEVIERPGRMRRRRSKNEYVRMISLSEEQRRIIYKTRLIPC